MLPISSWRKADKYFPFSIPAIARTRTSPGGKASIVSLKKVTAVATLSFMMALFFSQIIIL
jgi:hypothetical protein